jgi:hypothetical protein
MRPQFSTILKNRTFVTIALALIAILLIGLISVAGVALYGKITGQRAPAILPSVTAVKPAASTPQPTATVPPTQQPTATKAPALPSPTPQDTAIPETPETMPTTSPVPSATPGGDGEMPNTGGPLWQVVLAGGGLAAVAALARSGRRKA